MKKFETKWTTTEPNIISAKRKNDLGLCCYTCCNNKLSNPPDAAYFGLKVCKKCRKQLDKECDKLKGEIQREMDEKIIRRLSLEMGLSE